MIIKISYLFCNAFIVLSILNHVYSQICTEKQRSEITHTKTTRVSLLTTMLRSCAKPRGCVEYYIKWVDKPQIIKEVVYKTIQKCCDGYTQENSTDVDNLKCNPVCRGKCPNGYCDKPGICGCNEGYIKTKIWYGSVCAPVCHNNCTNGRCTAPETCTCNHGYTFKNDTCQPICSDPCINGTCVAPESCNCWDGYRKYKSNTICEPYCSIGCENGKCIAPETCQCNPGWHKGSSIYLDLEICISNCNNTCLNGTDCNGKKCVIANSINETTTIQANKTDDILTITESFNMSTVETDVEYVRSTVSFNATNTLDPQATEYTYNWLYIIFIGLLAVLIAVALIVFIVLKTDRCDREKTYMVEDRPRLDQDNFLNLSFSEIAKETD